ncbi:MAG: hypothetical protein JO345_07745 [Streptosporangiaceae bacterium]|nr:hypothetical protein [Streptosporangiaceae bacterium]
MTWKPPPGSAWRHRAAAAVVGHLDDQLLGTAGDEGARRARAGVLDQVGERLLDDPVGRHADPGGQIVCTAGHRELDS